MTPTIATPELWFALAVLSFSGFALAWREQRLEARDLEALRFTPPVD